jgi:hypothetical protein
MDHRPAAPVGRQGPGGRRPLFGLIAILALASVAGWGSLPATVAAETLGQSREGLRQFPFQPDCGGNTQEMVACLWDRRNQGDAALAKWLGTPEILERWRSSRRQVCRQAAEKAKGGSIHPIVWLSCENGLNKELLRQIRRPLLESADL